MTGENWKFVLHSLTFYKFFSNIRIFVELKFKYKDKFFMSFFVCKPYLYTSHLFFFQINNNFEHFVLTNRNNNKKIGKIYSTRVLFLSLNVISSFLEQSYVLSFINVHFSKISKSHKPKFKFPIKNGST